MAVTIEDLQYRADQLLDAMAIYNQFVTSWSDKDETIPDEVEIFAAQFEQRVSEPETSLGKTLTTIVTDRYYEACEARAKYVEETREQGCSNWSRIVEETASVREAIQQVHTTGYRIDPETGERDYLLPSEQCPAQAVSMNTGCSPVTFDDRIAQYRAIVNHFDFSPELIYYPGSGHDVSLSEAFAESRVVYVDVDEAAMADLNCAGYDAVSTDAVAYELDEKADMIVFRNAGVMPEPIVETNLRTSGFVLANDHLESATQLRALDSLELVGIVPDTWVGDIPDIERASHQSTGSYKQISESDRTTGKKPSSQLFENGTPLDLYIFQANA